MNKPNSVKTKINSIPNGHKKSVSRKTVCRELTSGKVVAETKAENSVSRADQLTLQAWKKTFENRKKVA